MKSSKVNGTCVFFVLLMQSAQGLAQLHDEEAMKAWGEGVSEDVIAGLVNDRSWHIDWSACMGGSDGCKTYWDFTSAGTICARGIDAKPDEKCADDGKWRIENNSLCWDLTWMGGGSGYKSTCVLVKEASSGGFEATRARGLGIPFFSFNLVKK